jgi:hypothetical protein
MFLSNAQLGLIERLYEEGKIDLLDVNIATTSALVVRGLVVVQISKKVGVNSYVELTDIGESLAANLDLYEGLPKYRDMLGIAHKAKYGY